MTVWTSPPEPIANDGTACDQPPTHDEAKGRRHLAECQQSCQARKAQREHEAERASRYSAEPRADVGQIEMGMGVDQPGNHHRLRQIDNSGVERLTDVLRSPPGDDLRPANQDRTRRGVHARPISNRGGAYQKWL